jgi:hypothetical protein
MDRVLIPGPEPEVIAHSIAPGRDTLKKTAAFFPAYFSNSSASWILVAGKAVKPALFNVQAALRDEESQAVNQWAENVRNVRAPPRTICRTLAVT